MKRNLREVVCIVVAAAVLAGCAGAGRGHGPVEAFAFLAAANPQLPRGAVGAIDYATEPKEIQVVVPPGTDVHGLVATLSLNKEGVVTVISSGTRVVQQNGATPNDFSVPVTYSIEVSGDKKPWTYRVTVREAQTNARLSGLTVPAGTVLSPGFSPTVHAYTLDVPFATTKVRIEARGQSAGLHSVTIDGTETAGRSSAGSVDFQNVQARTITISTLAEDGVTQEQYTVTIRRGPPDSNAFLSTLELANAPISPVFNPALLTYQTVVPFETTQLVLMARPQSRVATITLNAAVSIAAGSSPQLLSSNGDPAGSGAHIDFPRGERLALTVAVTAEDGSFQQYVLTVVRAAPDSNALLSGLSLFLDPQTGMLVAPAFSAVRFSYVSDVPYATERFTVRATPQSRLASLALEPLSTQQNVRPTLTFAGTPDSQNGALVEFPAAQRRLLFALVVTAQDGSIQRTAVEVRRAPPDPNADLASLLFSVGAMTPSFAARTASYSLVIPASADSVIVTAAAARAVAAVSIAEQPGVKPAATQSLTVAVAQGASSVVTFVVTAQDGSQKLYRLQVSREAAPISLDGNALLQSLLVSGTQLAPAFNPSILQYDAKMPFVVDSVIVTAQAQSAAAVVAINGRAATKNGTTIIVAAGETRPVLIDVTAQSRAVLHYTLRVTRDKAPPVPLAAVPQMPADTGTDHILVAAKNLGLQPQEASALATAKDSVTGPARVTIRYYRSTEIISQYTAAVDFKQQGSNVTLSFTARSNGVTLKRDRLVEVETALQTGGGKWLSYTEAQQADAEIRMDVPFLLYGDNPSVRWPALGAMVSVTGYLSSIPLAKERAADREDFGNGARGEFLVTVAFTDAKTGAEYGSTTFTVKPAQGQGRDRVISFVKPIQLPEGTAVKYALSAKAKNGKVWSASGTTQVWTVKPLYPSGFQPASLSLADELAPGGS